MMTVVFVLSGVMSVIYFITSSVISYSNLKALNMQVYENKKQAKEIKRLLEIFPHWVIIQSGDWEQNFKIDFTNEQFNEQIKDIRNKLEELKEIDVINEDSKTDLHKFLVSKQLLIVGDKVIKHKKLVVRWGQNRFFRRMLEPEYEEEWEKVFSVKSMKVCWNGKPCFMHVFFTNEDILMLEEANNNIKLQKIMFASVSHEFRTPLNAIIHSFSLTKGLFEKLMPIVQNLLILCKDK
jgi:hypothetical protein